MGRFSIEYYMKVFVQIIFIVFSINLVGQQFQLLNFDETGIDFNNKIEDTKEANILIYSNYYGGAGVGVGDFNNDGLDDVFFAGNLVDDRLYYNQGDLKFIDGTEVSKINKQDGWSSGVVVADFNNDGWLDIYITRELYDDHPERRRNKLYINSAKINKDGYSVSFFELADIYNLDDDERTRHAGIIDYNQDGHIDLILLNQPPNPGNFSPFSGENLMKKKWSPKLFRNNGNRTFTEVTEEVGLTRAGYANSVISTDFDKDGDVDIYISNDYEAPDFLYVNQGNGTFKEQIKNKTKHISYYSMGVDAADLNNDGWPEIMTLDMVAEDNFRLKSNMSGMDVNTFYKIVETGGHYQYMFNSVHKNNEGQGFSDIGQMMGVSSTDWSWSNLLADFDNDGLKDIYITNGLVRDIRNTDADKDFAKYVEGFIQKYLKENPNAGEVNLMDILPLKEALEVLPSVPLQNYMYKNNGNWDFEKVSNDWGFTQKSFSNGSAYSDLDNDGDLDIIVSNINAEAFIYENTSEKQNYLSIEIKSEKNLSTLGTKIEVTKTDGSILYEEITPVRGMYSCSQQRAHFGLGDDEIVPKIQVILPDNQRFYLKNVKVNQRLSLVIEDQILQQFNPKKRKTLYSQSGLIEVKSNENAFDDYSKQVLLPHKLSHLGPAISVADLNDDSIDDIYVGGALGHSGKLYISNSLGGYTIDSSEFVGQRNSEDIDALFLDVDNDNDLDLYVVSGGNEYAPQSIQYQDRLYINNQGSFTISDDFSLPIFRESGSVVKAKDFNNDGFVDLFIGGRIQPWSYPSPTTSRLLLNTGSSFKDITSKSAPDLALIGMITDADWLDYDEDGDEDILIVGEWMPISVMVNDNGIFSKKTLIEYSEGWWNSIEVLDLNKDGEKEILLGNLGLNYKYKASKEEPFEVFYDDFDENGSKDIVLSYYNFGEQFPLRGRSCSAQQVPSVADDFPSYNIFASSSLESVYGKKQLDEALHLSAYNFASGYLQKNKMDKYEFIPFPNEMQISSINDFLTLDSGNDVEFISIGNNYAVEIETQRNDGGIGLLSRYKDDSIEVVPYSESGIYTQKDSRKIRRLKVNSEGFIIANNNGSWDYYIKN